MEKILSHIASHPHLLSFSVGAEEVAQPPQRRVISGYIIHSTSITILNPLDGLGEEPADDGLIQAVALSDGSFGVIIKPALSCGLSRPGFHFPERKIHLRPL